MKKSLIFLALLLTACGPSIPDVPEVPELGDLPTVDSINAQIEADLAAAGIDVDMDELNAAADVEAELDTVPAASEFSDSTMVLDQKEGTAVALWTEVKNFAEDNYKGATLVAYNSYAADSYQDLFLPAKTFTDGSSELWYYFFALDGALEDEMIYASEIVVVEFNKGKLSFMGGDFTVNNEFGGKQVSGDNLMSRDTSSMVGSVMEAIEGESLSDGEIVHLDFECKPEMSAFAEGRGYCKVYAFEKDAVGVYEVGVYLDNGEIDRVEYNEIEEFTI